MVHRSVGIRQEYRRSCAEQVLVQRGHAAYRLDGDNVRMGLNKNLGFSAEDRTENIRRIGEVCKLFADSGMITLSSFISPYVADRDAVRALHDEDGLDFIEVYVQVPLEVAEERDPKGLYKEARAGEIKGFTGIDDPYEEPSKAEIVLPTHELSVEESVLKLLEELESRGLLTSERSQAFTSSVFGSAATVDDHVIEFLKVFVRGICKLVVECSGIGDRAIVACHEDAILTC